MYKSVSQRAESTRSGAALEHPLSSRVSCPQGGGSDAVWHHRITAIVINIVVVVVVVVVDINNIHFYISASGIGIAEESGRLITYQPIS